MILQAQQARAAVECVDPAEVRQDGRPVLADDGEEAQGAQPVAREIFFDQRFQLLERHAVDRQFVEQARELAGKLQRLRRRLGDRLAPIVPETGDEFGEQRFAFGRFDGRRQGEGGAVSGGGLPVAVVDVAQRSHVRQ